jgi:hypothetical protein
MNCYAGKATFNVVAFGLISGVMGYEPIYELKAVTIFDRSIVSKIK